MGIANSFVRVFIRVFFPGFARDLKQEGQFDFRPKLVPLDAVDLSDYIEVQDNGSDITVVSFAGMAVLYAGMPRFEFRKVLEHGGSRYNFVFVRDIHRCCYFVTPDGSSDGTVFYEGIIRDALARLNAKHTVAIGASGGGAAAFCIGSRLPIDHIIAFNPAFPFDQYQAQENQRRARWDVGKLLHDPGAYFEVVLVLLGARLVWRRVCRFVGEENVPDITARYLERRPRPVFATILYSARNRADTNQALQFREVATIRLTPVDSARHNGMRTLKERGELGELLQRVIHEGIALRDEEIV